ncbi:MAG: MarR family transcriptional regulator [Micromonosporaceae bacterium]|nr:MarR family transcriptional regulator [Micromonosporaceae bacterium]
MRELNAVRRVVRRRLRATLGLPPLSGSQVELLRVIEQEPGIGVAATAHAMHLAGNTVSGVVNQLAGAGLLRRERDPADGRAARLYLTPAATRMQARWRSARVRLVRQGLARLDAADRTAIAAALPGLHRLAAVLAEAQPPASTPRGKEQT